MRFEDFYFIFGTLVFVSFVFGTLFTIKRIYITPQVEEAKKKYQDNMDNAKAWCILDRSGNILATTHEKNTAAIWHRDGRSVWPLQIDKHRAYRYHLRDRRT